MIVTGDMDVRVFCDGCDWVYGNLDEIWAVGRSEKPLSEVELVQLKGELDEIYLEETSAMRASA